MAAVVYEEVVPYSEGTVSYTVFYGTYNIPLFYTAVGDEKTVNISWDERRTRITKATAKLYAKIPGAHGVDFYMNDFHLNGFYFGGILGGTGRKDVDILPILRNGDNRFKMVFWRHFAILPSSGDISLIIEVVFEGEKPEVKTPFPWNVFLRNGVMGAVVGGLSLPTLVVLYDFLRDRPMPDIDRLLKRYAVGGAIAGALVSVAWTMATTKLD